MIEIFSFLQLLNVFGFLGVTEPVLELEMERRLVEKIKLFLLELGKGFTFIGNQHVLEYNGITRKWTCYSSTGN
jgi:predicted nuclease of restriction endonuclease-like (RecB) superfamily